MATQEYAKPLPTWRPLSQFLLCHPDIRKGARRAVAHLFADQAEVAAHLQQGRASATGDGESDMTLFSVAGGFARIRANGHIELDDRSDLEVNRVRMGFWSGLHTQLDKASIRLQLNGQVGWTEVALDGAKVALAALIAAGDVRVFARPNSSFDTFRELPPDTWSPSFKGTDWELGSFTSKGLKLFSIHLSALSDDPEQTEAQEAIAGAASIKRVVAKRATKEGSVLEAISSIWPTGIPPNLTPGVRNQRIWAYLQGQNLSDVSRRTIVNAVKKLRAD